MADVRGRDIPVQHANQQMSDGVPVPLIATHQMSTIELAMFALLDVRGDYRPVTSQSTLVTASPVVLQDTDPLMRVLLHLLMELALATAVPRS
jgi:hypothetical protein